MPHMTDRRLLADHLGEILRARTHWILIADRAPGHLALVRLALQLEASGTADLIYGTADILSRPSLRRLPLSLLTVPKRRASARKLRQLLRRCGIDTKLDPGQDLVVICQDRALDTILALLQSAYDGKLRCLETAAN
jgi:hypothetical protein